MEVDFAEQTFKMIDRLNGEIDTIVVFVAVLPYSQFIYAEGMVSIKIKSYPVVEISRCLGELE